MNLKVSPPVEALDTVALRRTLGAFATGVTVVTTAGMHPHGMTANSFTSVSLSPPLVLVCIGRDALMHERLDADDRFGVSVLAAHQETVARHFSDRWKAGPGQFEQVAWRPGPSCGVPLLDDAVAAFECAKWRIYDGGDHSIVLGRVLAFARRPEPEPLVFQHGRFWRLQQERSEVAS